MNLMTFCVAPLVLGAAPILPPTSTTSDPTLAALSRMEDAGLSDLRGGAPELRMALDDQELASLRAADAAAPDLADLRGGTLDDHDLTIIAVVALVIIAVAILI